ncbi:MAG: protein translocase subunit SecF [Pyrinomonadaceae bacterium]|nr:protein translocase subunit SecF [Pyrinomonadaceae bacterium]
MIQFFKDVRIDWLADRRIFITVSTLIMLAGLASAIVRQAVPGGTEAFNLGVDFKGGTVVTVKFRQRPTDEQIRSAVAAQGISDAVIQLDQNKPDEALIRLPLQNPGAAATGATEAQAQVDVGREKVRKALESFGPETKGDFGSDPNAAFKIEGTDQVGPVAGQQLRNQAVAVTLLALVGILAYIGFRFEWSYGAAAVIAVFHDVLVTLGFFSLFQWEISLTVIAALLTLVGFSVNDTIVVFDRIRENLRLHRRESLYKITNDAINQTLSRTVITSGLVFLSVLAMVVFGGEVLRGFSLALLIGIVFGTYSSIAIASPIMVWWQERLDKGRTSALPTSVKQAERAAARGSAARAGGGAARSSRGTQTSGGGGSRVGEPHGAARS